MGAFNRAAELTYSFTSNLFHHEGQKTAAACLDWEEEGSRKPVDLPGPSGVYHGLGADGWNGERLLLRHLHRPRHPCRPRPRLQLAHVPQGGGFTIEFLCP